MSRHVYYDIDGNEIDEDELTEIDERLERIERVLFGGER